jgi:hypothetical protein
MPARWEELGRLSEAKSLKLVRGSCLRDRCMVDGHRRISRFSHAIKIPTVPLYDEVKVHMVPNSDKGTIKIRICWNRQPVRRVALRLHGSSVHL